MLQTRDFYVIFAMLLSTTTHLTERRLRAAFVLLMSTGKASGLEGRTAGHI